MSQDALAELLDVSRQSVSKWENDTAQPELSKLTIMCDLFGVSLDELARGKQPQPAAQPESQESQGSQESQASPESETSLHAAKRTKSLQRTLGIGLPLFKCPCCWSCAFKRMKFSFCFCRCCYAASSVWCAKNTPSCGSAGSSACFSRFHRITFSGFMSITFHGSLSSSGPSSLSATSFGRALPRNAAESDIKQALCKTKD